LAQGTAPQPQVIAPKGLGPGFWTVTAVLGILSLIDAWFWLYGPLNWILPQASAPVSDSADHVDGLFKFMSVFGGAICIFVTGYVIYFAYAFRRRPGEAANSIGVQIHDAPRLEFWWTLLPTLLLVVLMGFSIVVWHDVQFPGQATALTMEVVAHQYNFEFRYPGLKSSVFSPDLMHLPVGKEVQVLISSGDVLHSFWVPEFRVKAGAVPGLVQNLNFTPTRTGTFDIVCTEFCGPLHSKMQGRVVVEPVADFEKWYAQTKSKMDQEAAAAAKAGGGIPLASGDAAAGKALFAQKCAACHSLGGYDQKIVGPGLGQLMTDKSHPNLVNGTPVTPANIAQIIVKGYSGPIGVMPSRQATGVSDQDIANLVAYLTSLK
jgi:cytochrome c oxidase subunit 2